MKKTLRILLALLTLALLTSALFVVASATDGREAEPTAWTPSGEYADVYFGVWETEQDYLSGKDPEYTDLNDGWDDGEGAKIVLRSSFLKSLDPKFKYVRLFKDMDFSAYGATGTSAISCLTTGRSMTVDLGGHTLTIRNYGNFVVSDDGTPAYMTIKNGDIYNERQIHFRKNSSLTLDHVNMTSTAYLGYHSGGALYVIDSYIEISKDRAFSLGARSEIGEIKFIRSDLVLTSSNIASGTSGITSNTNDAIFVIGYNEADKANATYDNKWKIYFDKDSSITAPNMAKAPNLISVIEFIEIADEKGCPEVTFELGCKFDAKTIPSFTYVCRPYGTTEYSLLDSGDGCKIKITNPDSTEDITKPLFTNEVSTGIYSLSLKSTDGNISWYVAKEGDRIIKGVKGATVEGYTRPVLTKAELDAFPAGATVTIVENIDIHPDAAGSTNKPNGLTFDLGGNTIYITMRWTLISYENEDARITFKNGKIVGDIPNTSYLFMGNFGVTGVFTLEKITIEHTTAHATRPAIYPYNGTFNIIGCTINSNTSAIYCNETHGSYNIYVENSTLYGTKSAIKFKMNHNTDDTITIVGSTLKSEGYALDLSEAVTASGATPTENNKVKIDIKGSTLISSKGVFGINKSMTSAVHLAISETSLSNIPAVSGQHTLTIPKGERTLLSDSDTTPYRIGRINSKLYTNLTLKSDFQVNFFVPLDSNIISLNIAGTEYKVSDLTSTVNVYGVGECYNIIVTKLLPDVAAETMTYTVTYRAGDETFTVEVGYSLVDYLGALLKSEYSPLVKELAVSAGEYVASAYAYSGKTSAELNALRATDEYKANLKAITSPESVESEMTLVASAIKSACLDLGATMKVRFNLKEDFTGSVKIMGKSYDVTLGKVDGLGYILVEMSAYDMYDKMIPITVGNVTVNYSLKEYVSSIMGNSTIPETSKDLVLKFYYYTECSDKYVNASVGQ